MYLYFIDYIKNKKPGIFTAKYGGVLAVMLQTFAVLLVFWRTLFQPQLYLFSLLVDGVKNYFTYKAYIEQRWDGDIFTFKQFNFPFGDIVLYTDNTPLLAVPLKLFCYYIYDVSDYAFLIFNIFILLGILLSTWLLYLILRQLTVHYFLAISFSVLLPWVNPQMWHLFFGQYNLTLSWVPLLSIWFLMYVYQKSDEGSTGLWWLVMAGAVVQVFISFIHLYYLLIQITFAGFFFSFWVVYRLYRRQKVLSTMLYGFSITLLPLMITLAIVKVIDPYYSARKKVAIGYFEWKHDVMTLFATPPGKAVNFILYNHKLAWHDTITYLGAFFLWGAFGWVCWRIISTFSDKLPKPVSTPLEQRVLLILLSAAAIGCLLVALGERFTIGHERTEVNNYLNVFRYLREFIPQVTQFRSLGRFSWFIFWICQIILLFILNSFLRNKGSVAVKSVTAILICITVIEAGYAMLNIKKEHFINILTGKRETQRIRELFQGIDFQEYQAILPLPFYHIGGEDASLHVDPIGEMSLISVQTSLLSGLPLMSSNMSRTPIHQVKVFKQLFMEEEVPTALKNKLNDKPILVLYNRKMFDRTFIHNEEVIPQFFSKEMQPSYMASYALLNGIDFPGKLQMRLIKKEGDWSLYHWEPK